MTATGISIPSSYTAHLAPLSSSKLYNEARSGKNAQSLETPYVVMFQAVNILSGDKQEPGGRCGPQIQECWEFEHPRKDVILNTQGEFSCETNSFSCEMDLPCLRLGTPLTNNHNVRSARLRFWIPHAGVLQYVSGSMRAVRYV